MGASVSTIGFVLLLLTGGMLPGCGDPQAAPPAPPETLDLVLEWPTGGFEGSGGNPPTLTFVPVWNWRAEFRPDHTFRYAWQDANTKTWRAVQGRWRTADDEPWAPQIGRAWVLAPEDAPVKHRPDVLGRERPMLQWSPAVGMPGGPYQPQWILSTIDPQTGVFTSSATFLPDDR